MDALELSLRCSSLLLRSMSSAPSGVSHAASFREGRPRETHEAGDAEVPLLTSPTAIAPSQQRQLWNESDLENHFRDQGTTVPRVQ